MPLIQVKLYDHRLEDETVAPRIVSALTNALASVVGESVRDGTWVILDTVPPGHWGIAGRVGEAAAGVANDGASSSVVRKAPSKSLD
jgi:4-oxalocrotonate tautomerase